MEFAPGKKSPVLESEAVRFPATIFLSAFLLFEVEPLLARYILPWFGGGPAVWTNCLLFFQAVLLAGYLYAHWLGSAVSIRRQAWVHTGILAASLLFLPIVPSASLWRPDTSSDPSGKILLLLTATVGGPYLALSATAPLLQRWFNVSEPKRAPWRLYALSNFASFLAMLSYPILVEPVLRLHTQVWIWSGLYVAFAGLCAWTGWRLHEAAPGAEAAAVTDAAQVVQISERTQDRADSGPAAAQARTATAQAVAEAAAVPPSAWTVLFWVGLAAAGSTLLLATTNQISQEIAVNPFLWVLPLSVYLLTFVLVFADERWYRRSFFAGASGILAPAVCAVIGAAVAVSLWAQLAIDLAALFVTCMVCHGEIVRSRPSPRYLTTFYLAMTAGGVLGGIFVALLAPHVFTEFTEYPIGLAAACLLGLLGWLRSGALAQWTSRNLAVRIPAMALLLGGVTSVAAAVINHPPSLQTVRNFYGILRVTQRTDENGLLRQLTHGRIDHGFQYLSPDKRDWPTTYYGPHSGAGIVLSALNAPARRIAVIGLGTGTLAAWGRPGDTIRFYEINPDVENIARRWFTFLKDSKARTEVVLGDARVQLERELTEGHSHDFDVIAVDAFSGDSIPLHLLTAECGDIYRQRLAPGGLLLMHISNRSLNLEPVVRGLAEHLGWQARLFVSGSDEATGERSSRWVLITNNAAFLDQPAISTESVNWTHPAPPPLMWTDDFASLWHVLKF